MKIYLVHTKAKPIDEKVDFKKLEVTTKFSGVDISSMCNRAAILALKRYLNNKNNVVNDIKLIQSVLLTLLTRSIDNNKKNKLKI